MTKQKRPFAFPKEFRLRNSAEFQRAFQRKCSVSNDWLIIYVCENDSDITRLGMSVSRKVGNAVKRNRLRRLYREAFRLTRSELTSGLDLVLIPRRKPEMPTLTQIQDSLRQLVPRATRKLQRGSKRS